MRETSKKRSKTEAGASILRKRQRGENMVSEGVMNKCIELFCG